MRNSILPFSPMIFMLGKPNDLLSVASMSKQPGPVKALRAIPGRVGKGPKPCWPVGQSAAGGFGKRHGKRVPGTIVGAVNIEVAFTVALLRKFGLKPPAYFAGRYLSLPASPDEPPENWPKLNTGSKPPEISPRP